jgi:hypothetical protein
MADENTLGEMVDAKTAELEADVALLRADNAQLNKMVTFYKNAPTVRAAKEELWDELLKSYGHRRIEGASYTLRFYMDEVLEQRTRLLKEKKPATPSGDKA